MAETAQAPEKVEAAPPARTQVSRTEPKKDTRPEIEPPYKVLLHNDEVNLFENVVRLLQRLTPLSAEEAFQRTTEAHVKGMALLLSTHKERAELYVEQLTSAGLTVTMESDS